MKLKTASKNLKNSNPQNKNKQDLVLITATAVDMNHNLTDVSKLLQQNTCDFCKKTYKTEKGYLSHVCEVKRRWLNRDDKHAKIALCAYQKFYQLSYKGKITPTYEDFMRSKFYSEFVRFGRYLNNLNAIEPMEFVVFLIKNNVKLSDWFGEEIYESWVRELCKKESADRALERSILLMDQWAREHGDIWQNFFVNISTPLATKWIKSGRISPWILYCKQGARLLDRLSEEQLVLIKDWIDPRFWKYQFNRSPDELTKIANIFAEAGIE